MKNVRTRVRQNCSGNLFDYAIWNGNRKVLQYNDWYVSKSVAVRAAKRVAKLLRIKYDPKSTRDHGC